MATSPQANPTRPVREVPADLHYSVWMLRDAPGRSLAQLLLLVVVILLLSWSGMSRPTVILLAMAFFLTTWRHWFPARYELGPSGIVESTWWGSRRVAWSLIARWKPYRTGVLLFPDFDERPLAVWRSRWLPWNLHRQQLLDILEFYVPPPRPTAAS
jgi:hypothetical protein